MKIVLIGIQGAGKSTQGNLLSTQLNLPYVSTGHIFREIAKEKTKLGRYLKETMSAGFLIPDDKTMEIVTEYLKRDEYRKGYILDGFPRTVHQVKNFKAHIDKVIYLKIPDKDALWRLAYRNDSTRDDETLPALKKRMELFHKLTHPVVDYYDKQGKLAIIDARSSVEQVNKDILGSLGKQIVEDKIIEMTKRKKTILAVVGLPGAGKTAASQFFREAKKLPIIEFGKIINEYIEKHKLQHIESVHKKVRTDLRLKYGQEALAILNKNKITSALKNNEVVVIDGMRSWKEYTYLKDQFKDVRLVVLALYADKKLRYKRIHSRGFRAKLAGEQRDLDELIGINMAPTLGFADYFVDANSSLADLNDKLEVVYRKIYYS